MPNQKLTIEELPVESLVPYAHNANIHTDEQIDQIVSSIEEFGFNDPVGVYQTDDGSIEIVEGHGRVLAAKKLGMKTVPVISLNHMTDEQRRAYTHVHNQLTRNSQFDLEILEMDLGNLNFDWQEFGFDKFEYNPDDLFEPEGKQEEQAQDESADEQQDDEGEVEPLTCPQCGYVFGEDD